MPKPIIPDTIGDAIKTHSDTSIMRGQQAHAALKFYQNLWMETSAPVTEETVTDLLTDMRHACNQAGYNFDELVSTSWTHFVEEVN